MLKDQGDRPHPDKNPRILMNAATKPCQLNRGSYQAVITPSEEVVNIYKLGKLYFINFKTSVNRVN